MVWIHYNTSVWGELQRVHALRAHHEVQLDIEENERCISENHPWFPKMIYSLKGTGH